MLLEIVKYGHPTLRQRGAEVRKIDDKLIALAEDMIETMVDADGVGLAAQQVGVPLQLAVIDVFDVEDRPSTMSIGGQPVALEEHMPLVLLNPVLELCGEKVAGTEGCLSFPEITGEIVRAEQVKARAMTLDGETLEFEATGLLARALQHEVDHLNGILFIDRILFRHSQSLHSVRRS